MKAYWRFLVVSVLLVSCAPIDLRPSVADPAWLLILNPTFGGKPGAPEYIWVEEDKIPTTFRTVLFGKKSIIAPPEVVGRYGCPPWKGRLSRLQGVVDDPPCKPLPRPHVAFRLVGTAPPTTVTPDQLIVIDRAMESDRFSVSISQFSGRGLITVAYHELQFGFSVTPLGLRSAEHSRSSPLAWTLLVKNLSSTALQIDWNGATLVVEGRAYPVIHRGVKLSERSALLAPSTVPPAATLEEFVYPREAIAYVREWQGMNFFESMKPGERFTLYLPIKRRDDIGEYQFTFEVFLPEPLTPTPQR